VGEEQVIIKTKSGSTYEVDGMKFRRVNSVHVLDGDNEWADLDRSMMPVVGESMRFYPVKPYHGWHVLHTSAVLSIEN
jgi:hypothetical protein